MSLADTHYTNQNFRTHDKFYILLVILRPRRAQIYTHTTTTNIQTYLFFEPSEVGEQA
jgi:hypothetical protein